MSNYMANEINNLLALISWGQQSWEAVTFKMLEGGNQVIERIPREWNPRTATTTIPEIEERRICGNLDSENLAQFIAQAPSVLLSAQTEIGAAEIRIEKLKKEHSGEIYESNRKAEDWKQRRNVLSGAVETQNLHIAALEKKLARYEKKGKKKRETKSK